MSGALEKTTQMIGKVKHFRAGWASLFASHSLSMWLTWIFQSMEALRKLDLLDGISGEQEISMKASRPYRLILWEHSINFTVLSTWAVRKKEECQRVSAILNQPQCPSRKSFLVLLVIKIFDSLSNFCLTDLSVSLKIVLKFPILH